MTLPRWDRCVRHDEDNVPAFLAAYLADESLQRRVYRGRRL